MTPRSVGRVAAMLLAFVIVTLNAWWLHEVGEVRLTRAARRGLVRLRERIDHRCSLRIRSREVS